MKSERVNISLPVELKQVAQNLVDARHCGTISHLIEQLIKKEFERDAGRKRLEVLLELGYNSPIIDASANEYFDRARARITAKIA